MAAGTRQCVSRSFGAARSKSIVFAQVGKRAVHEICVDVLAKTYPWTKFCLILSNIKDFYDPLFVHGQFGLDQTQILVDSPIVIFDQKTTQKIHFNLFFVGIWIQRVSVDKAPSI